MSEYFKRFSWSVILALLITIYSLPAIAIEVKGTPHDLSSKGKLSQICQTCHIYKSANETNSLMDEEVNSDSYSKMQEILGLSSSLFCAQCHDGTVSQDNIRNTSEEVARKMGDNTKYRTRNNRILDDHPVNVEYPQGDPNFKSNQNIKLYGITNREVRCNTCHDPHKAGTDSFLRKKEGLCIDCHDK